MNEINLLIDYAELSGFSLSINQDKLRVNNGSNLSYHLKQMLMVHKDDILQQLSN